MRTDKNNKENKKSYFFIVLNNYIFLGNNRRKMADCGMRKTPEIPEIWWRQD